MSFTNAISDFFKFIYGDVTSGPLGLLLCFVKAIGLSILITLLSVVGVYILLTTAFLICCPCIAIILMKWEGFWYDLGFTYQWIWIVGLVLGVAINGLLFLPVWIAILAIPLFILLYFIYKSLPHCSMCCRKYCKCCNYRKKHQKVEPTNDNYYISESKPSNSLLPPIKKTTIIFDSTFNMLPPISERTIIFDTTFIFIPPFDKNTIVFESTFNKE